MKLLSMSVWESTEGAGFETRLTIGGVQFIRKTADRTDAIRALIEVQGFLESRHGVRFTAQPLDRPGEE